MMGEALKVSVKRRLAWMRAAAVFVAPLLAHAPLANAGDGPAVDTSRWACKYCKFEEGWNASLELGAGYVSDDSSKFGEYTGLDDEGVFAVGNAEAHYRSREGRWLDLTLTDFGLDTRALLAEGGKQGSYKLLLSYKETPHFITDTAVSPFLGTGSGVLTLPSGWVPATTTGGMLSLAASLHGIDLQTKRRAFDFGASVTPFAHWEFGVKVRHEEKTGNLGTAGSFLFNAAQFAMPVDYDTEQIDVSAAYSAGRFQARFAYYGSIFNNNEQTLTWANPYVPIVSGASSGQLAEAPSNQFHQLLASAGFELSQRTHATADVAVGRMTQDEAFVPYTLNAGLTTTPLPRSSLDGRVTTVRGNVRITSALTDRLRLNAAYSYDDRDNRTPQALYDWITTDALPAPLRTNLPYSLTHRVAKLDGGFAFTRDLRVDAGCDYDVYERDLQEVRRTHEYTCWGKGTARVIERADIMLKGAHARRTGSDYTAVPGIVSPENPLLRKYNLADRDRDSGMLRVDVELTERASLGAETSLAWDKYRNSVLGLLDGHSESVAADTGFAFSDDTSMTGYLSYEQIRSRQANAELIPGSPIWSARNKDTIETAGVGIKHHASDKFDIGANYTVSRSIGEIDISGAAEGFPDLTTRLHSVKLYATYRLKDKLSLHVAYWYERYQSRDWMLDGVAADTIPNVISFGQGTPAYHVHVIALSGRYEF
jgi:MtrB/PioB family decaheme-associated outer membrane protein